MASPAAPYAAPLDSLTALAAARDAYERTSSRAAAAVQALNDSRAALEALDPEHRGYAATVRAVADARDLRDALAARQARAAKDVESAAALVATEEEDATRAQVRALDAAIKAKGLELEAKARQVGGEFADQVNALKATVAEAHGLARSLPGWKPSGNEILGFGSDDRGSVWAVAPRPDALATPQSALQTAASMVG